MATTDAEAFERFVRAVADEHAQLEKRAYRQTRAERHRLLYVRTHEASERFARPMDEVYDALASRLAHGDGWLDTVRERIALIPSQLGALAADRANRRRFLGPDARIDAPAVSRPHGAPTVSIVTLCHQRREYVRRTLDVLPSTLEAGSHELIAVDNASSDGTADLLRERVDAGQIHKLILRRSNGGTSVGYNTGFAAADPRSAYLTKLDSDIVVTRPGWLTRFDRVFRAAPEVGALSMNLVNHYGLRRLPTEVRAGEALMPWTVWRAGGGGMTLPRRVFDELGFFSEAYGVAYAPDDADYHERLARKGYEAYYVREAHAWHQEYLDRGRYLDLSRRKWQQERAQARERVLREYDTRARSLTVRYETYDRIARHDFARAPVLEID